MIDLWVYYTIKFSLNNLLRHYVGITFLCPPLKKEGHIALHMSVGMSVCRSVCRSVGMSVALNLVQLITQERFTPEA